MHPSIETDSRQSREHALSDEEIERVVAQIRQICRDPSLEFALRVGGVVIHHFYDGDVAAWRSRGPKLHSFRRLAEHPELPMSPAGLYRCVAVFEVCERLKAPSRWRRLGASHLRSVIGLDSDTQQRLLSQANSEQWTVKVLRQEALRCRSTDSARGGRRAQSTLAKSLANMRRSLTECEAGLEREIAALSPTELEQTATLLSETLEQVTKLARVAAQRKAARKRGHAA